MFSYDCHSRAQQNMKDSKAPLSFFSYFLSYITQIFRISEPGYLGYAGAVNYLLNKTASRKGLPVKAFVF